jgi:diaminohydroxyphosphoribosylaminopyrimidine deaminase/5-amino-6-(5-phosphoribosylamino)uracil reductase
MTTPGNPDLDRRFMDLALALGRRGLGNTWPNPAVGAVLVRATEEGPVIVGRGWTQPGGRPHAEPQAIGAAGALARGATLYVTLEPCSHTGKTPPCADAIIAAGIARVVSAVEDPNPEVAGQGHARLRAAGIAVDVGEGAEAARRAHAGHFRRIRDGRPHVTLKMALSADGKVALAGRRPVALSGPQANARVHMMRAMNDAILIGVGTARSDDPMLTCRLRGMAARSPVRVVLDNHLRLPPHSRLVQSARDVPVWAMTAATAPAYAEDALHAQDVEVLRLGAQVTMRDALQALGARGVTRLLVEGGTRVAASLATDDLIDELVLIHTPLLIGADGIDPIAGRALDDLLADPARRLVSTEQDGPDTVASYARV